MDSMTLYRHMDIGTAKPRPAERRRIRHHLIDALEPWETATVAWWLEGAARHVREIESRGRQAILAGGTPLYLKAVLFGLFEGPSGDAEVRRRLEAIAKEQGGEALHRQLLSVDPASAKRLHANDVLRLVRALEVFELTGRPISAWQREWQSAAAVRATKCWWIDRPRPELYERINRRVERMIESGWIEEAKRLRELAHPPSRTALQALGYGELFGYLDGQRTLAETVELIQTRTRQFAKRQLTWFRSLSACRRLPVSGERWLEEAASELSRNQNHAI